VEALSVNPPQMTLFETPVPDPIEETVESLDAKLTKLLEKPLSRGAAPKEGKSYEPVRGDVYPEMHLRRLKNGSYAAGVELPNDRYVNATGATVVEAIQALQARLDGSAT
jgi:hypothetical protein